jgi:hypothetical protein
MKLSEITSTPKLVEIKLDDQEIVKEYGEALVFHTWDRQPLDIFMRLANIDTKNTGELISIVKTLILDEKGKEIVTDKSMLPTNVLLKAIQKVTDMLGK